MNLKPSILLFLCWIISLISLVASLFFSEVMEFPPCTLCWYQRIAMYPLAIIFLVGSFRNANEVFSYAMPLVVIGWLIALYHNLLHFDIIPESAAPCREGVSCGTVYIELFDFLTIPMMSLIAFSILGFGLMILRKMSFYEE